MPQNRFIGSIICPLICVLLDLERVWKGAILSLAPRFNAVFQVT